MPPAAGSFRIVSTDESSSNDSVTRQDETDDEVNPMQIFEWIGSGPFQCLPVYGATWAQIIWLSLLACMFVIQVHFAHTGHNHTAKILQELDLPLHLRIGLYILPLFTMFTIVKIVTVRKLLKMHCLAESVSFDSAFQNDDQSLLHKLHKHHRIYNVESEVVETEFQWRSTLPKVIRCLALILLILVSLVGIALCYYCRALFDLEVSFLFNTLLPLIIAWIFFLIASTSIIVFSVLWKSRISLAVKSFMHIVEHHNHEESKGVQQGEFVQMIKIYELLDSELISASNKVANVIFTMAGGVLVLAYFCVLVAINARRTVEVITMVSCCTGLGLVVILAIWPLARVTDQCISRKSLKGNTSLMMSAMLCAQLSMETKAFEEYLRLVSVMEACPIGIKIPFLGLVDTQHCATWAKTLAAFTPPLLTLIWNNYMNAKPWNTIH